MVKLIVPTVSKKSLRLDHFLTEHTQLSKTQIQELITNGQVLVNQKVVTKKGYFLITNDQVIIDHDRPKLTVPKQLLTDPTPLNIVYEDQDLLIVNKPVGILSHPTKFDNNHTLVNMINHYLTNNQTLIRSGLAHRLDKTTSGLMIVAKNPLALQVISKFFQERKVIKKYYALVVGNLPAVRININLPIGRHQGGAIKMVVNGGKNPKPASTTIRLIEKMGIYNLVECELHTGRTHQIRAHLAHLKCPILNDPLYGELVDPKNGYYLHAYYLQFVHPITNQVLELSVK